MTVQANAESAEGEANTKKAPDAILTLEHRGGHTSELRVFDAKADFSTDGQPRGLVLILPGIAVGARYYDPIAAAFAAAGFTSAITELPAQGTSTIGVGHSATPTGYHDAAAEEFPLAVATLREHAAEGESLPLFLLGHSQGGQLASYYVAREAALGREQPAGLIGVATQSPYYRGYSPSVGRRLRLGSVVMPLGGALVGSVPAAFFGGKGRQPARRIVDWAKLVRTGRMTPVGADVDYRRGMDAARVPTLAVTLEGDALAPPSAARYWLDFLPNSPRTMRHVTEDLGHNRWARRPGPVLELVLEWIDALGLAQTS